MDVRGLKNRIDPSVRALDATVAKCAGLDLATQNAWSDFSKAWRSYVDEDDSWLHTAAQYDTGESYERTIADWQRIVLILPRFGGQSDYAAIVDICIFNSNSIGLT